VVVVADTLLTVTDAPLSVMFTFWEGGVTPVCTLKFSGLGVATRPEVPPVLPTCSVTFNVPVTFPFDWLGAETVICPV